jgi:hypothetical protein
MPVHLTQVTIPRIPQIGGGNWTLGNLTEVTVLFGRNGSGKSVMHRAWRGCVFPPGWFEFFSHILRLEVHLPSPFGRYVVNVV